MKKGVFYSELAYAAGLLLLALGTALTEYGGLGISMVVAPAYLLHLKVCQALPFFSFGMAEYALQAVVLMIMMLLLRKVRGVYFLSFVTAVIYGFLLDGCMALTALLPQNILYIRTITYILGVPVCAAAIALLFHSYLPPEAYELLVKELAVKLGRPIHSLKILYDCCSLAVAIVLSLAFFGELRGIGIGTVACAFLNGTLIRVFSQLFARIWEFKDRFPLRARFEGSGVIN